ncbi:hypothetical protein ACQRWP_04160 [Micromonospora trifolii]|uniref:hypothetical protein n=1 Tax=Micromonospora trifolii TaxID=2911208 RepID=UPI003D2F1D90
MTAEPRLPDPDALNPGRGATARAGPDRRSPASVDRETVAADRLWAYAEKALASRWGRPGRAGED